MKSRFTISLAILAGVGIGAVAVQSLHAQNKPPVYFVGETEFAAKDASFNGNRAAPCRGARPGARRSQCLTP